MKAPGMTTAYRVLSSCVVRHAAEQLAVHGVDVEPWLSGLALHLRDEALAIACGEDIDVVDIESDGPAPTLQP